MVVEPVDGADKSAKDFETRLRRGGGWAGLLAILASAVFAIALSVGWQTRVVAFGSALVVGGAAGASGGLLGFLFGIPKTLQSDAPAQDGSTRYLGNTNLEQISDWLTKILVGISLVQIGRAIPALSRLGDSLRPILGGQPSSAGFGLALCIYAAIVAFVVIYLWTRINLRREMGIADQSVVQAVRAEVASAVQPVVQDKVDEAVRTSVAPVLQSQVDTAVGEKVDAAIRDTVQPAVQQKVDAAVDEQSGKDSMVLALVDRQLTGSNPPTSDELVNALTQGSQLALTQAFQRAEWQRKAIWNSAAELDQAALERTVPIFRALTVVDRDQKFHRTFGSLGFALKDIAQPDYGGARDALSQAIAIRDKQDIGNFKLYEWNRAVCGMMLDDDYENGRPTSDETRQTIVANLKAAAGLPDQMFEVPGDGIVDRSRAALARWLELNQATLVELRQ